MPQSPPEPHLTRFGSLQVVCLLLLIPFIALPIYQSIEYHNWADRPISCQSNEKQLGLALLQYEQDYDNLYPPGTRTSEAYGKPQLAGIGWAGQVFGYAKSTDVFHCPQDRTRETEPRNLAISYAFNSNIVRNNVAAAGFKDPSRTVMLFEVANARAELQDYGEGASKGETEFSPVGDGTAAFLDDGLKPPAVRYATGGGGGRPNATGSWLLNRHKGGANYLLADGHVKWLTPEQVSTGTNAAHPKGVQTGILSGRAAGTANPAYAVTFSTK